MNVNQDECGGEEVIQLFQMRLDENQMVAGLLVNDGSVGSEW